MSDVDKNRAGAEYYLSNVERLVAVGDGQVAMLSLDLYGPDFESQLDAGQAERLRVVMEILNGGQLEAPTDDGPTPFGMH